MMIKTLQLMLHIVDRLSNEPDEFSVDCPTCRGTIEVPCMKERDGRPHEDKESSTGNHLSVYHLECIHCGWDHPFVFPMPGDSDD